MDEELKLFEDYVHKFDLSVEEIRRKYNHTYRVMKYAEEIAKSLNLNNKEIQRAKICALFHDLGRFPQYEEFNTFNDKKSFDHGDKSEEILKNMNYNDEIVLNAVKYHNKAFVPEFDELTNIHCKIIRDADKLDIMDTQSKEIKDNNIEYNKDILNCFKEHRMLDNSLANTEVFLLLRMVAFIFDIYYEKSIEIIKEKDIINKKLSLLKDSEEKEFIESEIKKYIKERFDVIC